MKRNTVNRHVPTGHPTTAKQRKFCQEYIKDYNAQSAAKRAGFNKFWLASQGYRLLKTWGPYLAKLQDAKTPLIAKMIAVSQEDVLKGFASIIHCDPRDYVELVTLKELDKSGKETSRKVRRFKPLHRLTADQARLVYDVREGRDGRMRYRIPELRHRMKAFEQTGRHYGMFHDKFIAEHLHAHLHMGVDLSAIPSDKLKAMEEMLIKEMGAPAMRLLGYTPAQAAEATDGVSEKQP